MSKHVPHIALADLIAAGVPVRPAEAVTLVRELMRQTIGAALPGVPSAHVVRLGREGRLFVEGPVAADDRAVLRAALLLDAILPGFDAAPELRVPGALRLVVARARGTLDLPPYRSLQEFVAALDRFALSGAEAVVRDLYAAWSEAVAWSEAMDERQKAGRLPEPSGPAETLRESRAAEVMRADEPDAAPADEGEADLTVSDIRRARRATGLTLGEVSQRSRIPVWLLRELEWGYLRNWPAGQYGRTQLTRYARATGLDRRIVLRTLWPMLQADARQAPEGITVTDEGPQDPAPAAPVLTAALARTVATAEAEPQRSRGAWRAALAISALVAIGVAPVLWERAHDPASGAASVSLPVAERAVQPPAGPPAPADEPAASKATAAAPERRPTAAAAGDARPQRDIPEQPAYSPAFATVGSAMFYHTDVEGHSALMRADTDSRGAVLRITSVVDDRARNFHARPSPDGTQIAFDSDREGERAVFIADATGKNVRRVSGEGFAAIPSWSPDGRTLAFVRAEPDHPRVWNLWTKDLESGQMRRLTSYRVGQPWGASWFPDGTRIAYSHETRLHILDLASGNERVFDSPVKGRLVRTPAVSPDGRRVIFQVSKDGTWLLDVADGAVRKVLSDPSAEEYSWAPDGRRVAYHSRRSGDWGVWVLASR